MNDHQNTQPTQTINAIQPTHSQVPRTLEELVWLFSALRGGGASEDVKIIVSWIS
jgi:hypothetical protein